MRKMLALLLAVLSVLSLTACGTQSASGVVVAEVNGEKIYKDQANDVYDIIMKRMASSGVDTGAAEVQTQGKEDAIWTLAELKAMEIALDSLGAGLTEADIAQANKTAQEAYDAGVGSYVASYEGSTEEDAKRAMDLQGYSLVSFELEARIELVEMKLRDVIPASAVVTDEEVAAWFDEELENAKELYAETPERYAADVLGEAIVVYRPEGYRRVQNLVIGHPEDIAAEIEELKYMTNQIAYAAYSLRYEIESTLDQRSEEELAQAQAALEEYLADYNTINGEIEALALKGREAMQEKAEEILALCKAEGADFDALMDEYSTDPTSDEFKRNGYPVSAETTTYVPAFLEASMALESIGDISDLVPTEYGFHVLRYASDVTSGPVPLGDISARISEDMYAEKLAEAQYNAIMQAIEDADIKTYIDKM